MINGHDGDTIKVELTDLNYLPGYAEAESERRKNELERIENENERIDYYEDFQARVNRGELKGEKGDKGDRGDDGIYLGTEAPTDEITRVWIDPNGTPEVLASNIIFEDTESLQDKFDNGSLKGEKGEQGERGLQGEQGIQGIAGENGKDGLDGQDGQDGYTPVRGTDYWTEEDIATIQSYIDNQLVPINEELATLTTVSEVA